MYMVHRVLHPVFACPYVWTFAKPADIEFLWEKVVRLAEQQVRWEMVKEYAVNTEIVQDGTAASLYDTKMSLG